MSSQPKPSGSSPRAEDQHRTRAGLEFRADGQSRFAGCSKINAYEVLGKLGEGTFGEVHKARSKKTGKFLALKKILMHNEKDGFPITALREIKLLKMLSHPNVLQLVEMAVEHRRDGRKKAVMYMATPYMDHDLSGLLENPAVRITEPMIKCYMLQLLEGVRYLHSKQILHRDMKAANLLINNKGLLQIADFGLARPFDEAPPVAGQGGGEANRDYTTLVVTRWYRPPELLLQLRRYTTAIDLWGVGCVFGEMFRGRPILAGKSDLNQMELICQLVGSPTEQNMPGWSSLPGCEGIRAFGSHKGNLHIAFREQGSAMISLIEQLLKLDWRKRINAIDALKHPYFTSPPLPAKPGELPRFEDSHELDRRKFRDQQPPAPAGGTVGMGPNGGEWGAAQGNGQGRRFPPQQGGPPPPRRSPPRADHDGRFPHRNGGPPPDRRAPAWQQSQHRDLGLPPRPAKDANWSSWATEHGDKPRQRSGTAPHPQPGVDTYIPNYDGAAERRGRAPPVRHERGERNDRNRGYDRERRRSRSPRH